MKATLLFIITIFIFGISIFPNKVQAQEFDATCVSITFNPPLNSLMLTLSPNGNVQARDVQVSIRIDSEPPSTLGFNPNDFQIRYFHEDGGDRWIEPITFEQNLNPGTTMWEATTTMRIDNIGEWGYSFEWTFDVPINGSGSGCGPRSGTRNTVPFTIGAQPIEGDTFTSSCNSLPISFEDLYNHFSCERRSGASFGTGTVYSVVDSEIYCQEGYLADERLCEIGWSTNELVRCLPCTPSDEIGNRENRQYLEACDTSLQCDTSQGLLCLDANHPSDTEAKRCLHPSGTLFEGETCYIGGSECQILGGSGSTSRDGIVRCQPNESSEDADYIGSCIFDSEADYECFSDLQCSETFGEGFLCVPVSGTSRRICSAPGEIDNPIETSSSSSGSAFDSDQFGVRNCPHAVPVSPGSDTYVANPLVNAEQAREFTQCKTCIENFGTWTALGCISTTAQGVFNTLIRIALGIMGGVALLRLIYLGYLYNFGSEDKIKPATQDILATLGGLLVVIFSVLILRIIGVNVLDIVPPGFFGS